MKLHHYLKPELIKIDCRMDSMEGILREMVAELKAKNKINNENTILKKLLEREKLGSTSIGNHAAVPHTKLKDLKEPVIFIGITQKGVWYHDNDQEPVHLVILILSPSNSPIIHLQILAAAAALIKKSKNSIKEILAVDTSNSLIDIIRKYETTDD